MAAFPAPPPPVPASSLTDVDAAIVTLGGFAPGTITPGLAALALGGTIVANMTVKLGITIGYARGHGKVAALGLGASMAALLAALIVKWSVLGYQ